MAAAGQPEAAFLRAPACNRVANERARGAGLVGGVAQEGAPAARPPRAHPPMARVLLRKLLRYGGLALLRSKKAPGIYACIACPRHAPQVARARVYRRRHSHLGLRRN